MANDNEQMKKDVKLVLMLDEKMNYSSKETVSAIKESLILKKPFRTVIGKKYISLLNDAEDGKGIDKCLICNGKPNDNSVLCNKCVEKCKRLISNTPTVNPEVRNKTMKLTSEEKTLCYKCHSSLDKSFNYCPFCGKKKSNPKKNTGSMGWMYATLAVVMISIVCYLLSDDFADMKSYFNSSSSKYESSVNKYETTETESNTNSTTYNGGSSSNTNSTSHNSGSSYKTNKHYCEAPGCYSEGTRTLTGFSGETEYYCPKHYDEINSMIDDMEDDVGSSSSSRHQCEASGCSREGTHSLMGLSGRTEYYCTEHYKEIEDIVNSLY